MRVPHLIVYVAQGHVDRVVLLMPSHHRHSGLVHAEDNGG